MPIGQRFNLRRGQSFFQGIGWPMGANNVLDIIQYRHSNHRQLATLPVDLRAVAHGLVQLEPSACQRWAVQHQAIDIDQSPTPCPSDLRDEVGEFWMFFFFDQGYARHRNYSGTFRIGFIMIASRGDLLKINSKSST